MGYSNVAGDLNVLSTTSTQNLTVRGDTTLSGNLTAPNGFHNFGNVTVGNLLVTGNFTITATNTQTTNSLTITNAETATALKVIQNETGLGGLVHNVAEFYDGALLAMVIDPFGNVGIHVTSSPNYSLTVAGGALVDTMTSQLYFGNASGLSNLNSSNLVNPLTSLQLSNTQSNITSLGTLVNLNVSGTANIANGWFTTANVTGGLGANTAFFSLLKTNTSNTSFLNASNAAVSNLLCSNLNVLATANMAALTASLFIGNASGLSNINSSNLVGNVAAANIAMSVTDPAQGNITSVGVLSALTVAGIFQAGLLSGNASGLSNINSSNLVGNVAAANVASSVTNPAQANITSVGVLSSLTVSGVLQADLYAGNASGLSNINSSNLVGNVAAANVASSVTDPAQGNITSLGVLNSLTISGVLQAALYTGNASGLSNLNSSNLVGNVAAANVATSVTDPAQGNITSLGVLNSLTIQGLLIASNASGLSNLNSSNLVGNVASANAALVVTQPAQPNITSLGVLNSLTISGLLIASNASGLSNLNSSNLVGNVAAANVATSVTDPAQGNITSVGQLTSLTVTGVLQADLYSGNASGLSNLNSSNLVGNVAAANVATSVTDPAQGNITSLGVLNSLTISGLLIASNASGLSNLNSSNLVGNVAAANVATSVTDPAQGNITSLGVLNSLTISGVLQSALYTGNASGLSNLNSSNLVGNVASANAALVVTAGAQPNITSVGVLTGLTVSGILNSNLFTGNASGLSNINSSNLVGNVASANAALVVTAGAQPNITSVGVLSSLNVFGISNISTLNVSGFANLSSINTASINVANIYTTNIVGFVGSQWTGSVGQPIYYDSGNVAIGSSTVTGANLSVTGNLFVSNALTTSNLILTGTANVQTLNVATPIPITSGLYMNLNATYTLNGTGNWLGNIASSITSNLFTLFAPNPAAAWTTYGSSPLVTGPTGNGGFKFSQTGPWAFTAVITADNNIKTLALSSNTADVHSNLADTDVWEYVYRIGVGQDPSIPITIPFYVDNTNKYYFLDIETDNQTDNIHRTRYTNAAAEAYTGSYVILRPV
jgi:hypothetical protein